MKYLSFAIVIGIAAGLSAAEVGKVSEECGGIIDPGGVEWTDVSQAKGKRTVTFWSVTGAATNCNAVLEGSNDGKKWTLVDREDYQIGWTPELKRYWKCAKPAEYSQYRVTVTDFSNKKKLKFAGYELYAPVKKAGNVYYVDAASGDDSRTAADAKKRTTPWKTISRSVKELTAGDTVLVAPGIYREQIGVFPSKTLYGTAVDPITFRALDPKKCPVINGAMPIDPKSWKRTTVTNFRGEKIDCVVADVDYKVHGLYEGTRRLVVAHEPEQVDGDNPYDTKRMMTVPAEENGAPFKHDALTDSSFFVQKDPDYWKGGKLKVSDGYVSFFEVHAITGYDPAKHTITTEKFGLTIGPDQKRNDRYAICSHLGVMDKPGEFYIDSEKGKLYLVDKGIDLTKISAAKNDYGFQVEANGVEIDGFEFCNQVQAGVMSKHGSHIIVKNTTVRNCRFSHIFSEGVSFRNNRAFNVIKCDFRENGDNGFCGADAYDCQVFDCTICTNANNGIWCGNGTSKYFCSKNFIVRGCHLFDQSSSKSHPDNYQIHQIDDVVICDNVLEQQGHQNGWCQYSGHMIFCNNVLKGGTFGFGAVQYGDISHNLFDRSNLRFDAHNDDHPQHKDWYLPRDVRICDNIIFDSAMNWPKINIVPREQAFTFAGNLYNGSGVSSYDYRGKYMSFGSDTLLVREKTAAKEFAVVPAIMWSAPGYVIPLYKDPDNYYFYSIGAKGGDRLCRKLNGEVKSIGEARSLILGHARAASATNTINIVKSADSIEFSISKNDKPALVIKDSDPAAVKAFASATGYGFESRKDCQGGWLWVHRVFEDGEPLMIDAALTGWKTVRGKVGLSNVGGCGGTGLGAGSAIGTDPKLVTTTDGLPVGPERH